MKGNKKNFKNHHIWATSILLFVFAMSSKAWIKGNVDLDNGVGQRRSEAFFSAAARNSIILHRNTWTSQSPEPFFVVTAAYQADFSSRDPEYAYGLDYVGTRGFSAAIFVSEATTAWGVTETVPWDYKLYYTSPHTSKSAKESDALRALVTQIENSSKASLDENAMVIKLSGRYQVLRDELLMTVRNRPDVDMVAKRCSLNLEWCTGDEVYTFFFGLKWRYFRDFYSTVSMDALESTNVEKLLFEYAREKRLNIVLLPRLWVLGNIDNARNYHLY
jgi:hypothetical protein